MSDKSEQSEEYRRNAMVCLSMSHTTTSETLRASWLKLAESWLRMIAPDEPPAEESFDAIMRSHGIRHQTYKRPH